MDSLSVHWHLHKPYVWHTNTVMPQHSIPARFVLGAAIGSEHGCIWVREAGARTRTDCKGATRRHAADTETNLLKSLAHGHKTQDGRLCIGLRVKPVTVAYCSLRAKGRLQ